MDLVKAYALSFLGIPYKWGGSNPIEGLDCSGLVQLIMSAAGMDPPGDQTAQGLYNHFAPIVPARVRRGLGSLLFFGKDLQSITHVAWGLDELRMIEAGGGDHLTITREDAARKGAFVRISMIEHRKDLVAVVSPTYAHLWKMDAP